MPAIIQRKSIYLTVLTLLLTSSFWVFHFVPRTPKPLVKCPRYAITGQNELEQYTRFSNFGEDTVTHFQNGAPHHRFYNISFGDLPNCKNTVQVRLVLRGKNTIISNSGGSNKNQNCNFTLSNFGCYFTITISEETRGNKISQTTVNGGSNFFINMVATTTGGLWVCSVKDLFNGKYIVKCPLFEEFDQYQGPCFTVKITLMYIQFKAYQHYQDTSKIKPPLDLLLVERTICGSKLETADSSGHNIDRPDITGWFHKSNEWIWIKNGNRLDIQRPTSYFKKCLAQISHLTMIGSSHMRFMADYVLIKAGYMDYRLDRKHNSVFTKFVTFNWNTFGYELKNTTAQIKTNTSYEMSTGVIVAMTGAWDMKFHGIKFFIQSSGPSLITNLVSLKKDWKKARLIWFPTVPSPMKGTKSFIQFAADRNVFSLAAINAWIMAAISASESDIEVFDSMTMIFSRPNESVCGSHYICRVKAGEMKGEVGITAVMGLLQHLCS